MKKYYFKFVIYILDKKRAIFSYFNDIFFLLFMFYSLKFKTDTKVIIILGE